MKRYNVSLRGGAGNGNAYSQLIAEIDQKNVKFNILAGSSAGALYGSIIACGYNYYEAKKILKSIPLDFVMKWEGDIEKGKGFISKIVKGAIALPLMKTALSYAMRKKLKKYLSWEKVKQAGRVKDLRISCIDDKEIAFLCGSKKHTSMIDLLKAMKGKNKWEDIYKKVPAIWFTNKGIYCPVKILT